MIIAPTFAKEVIKQFMDTPKHSPWRGILCDLAGEIESAQKFILPQGGRFVDDPDYKAIEKGAEVASELIIYTILLSIPILEWWRQNKINKIKEEMKEIGIKRLRADVELLSEENGRLKKNLKVMRSLLSEINSKL